MEWFCISHQPGITGAAHTRAHNYTDIRNTKRHRCADKWKAVCRYGRQKRQTDRWTNIQTYRQTNR